MPTFGWDESAVLGFFCSVPEESEEYGRNLTFRASQGETNLEFSVNVDTADCSLLLSVRATEAPLFHAIYLGSPGARVVDDKRGRFLEIGAPGSFAGRYDGEQPLAQGLHLWLAPHLLVSPFVA